MQGVSGFLGFQELVVQGSEMGARATRDVCRYLLELDGGLLLVGVRVFGFYSEFVTRRLPWM